MLIESLENNSTVTLNITDGKRAVQLSSQILLLSDKDRSICAKEAKELGYHSFAMIKAITSGNYVVSFSSNKITCKATGIQNNKPYSWKDVKIIKLNLPDQGVVHMILSNNDVNTFNRRKEYRIFLGCDGICQFENVKEPKNVIVKDISCSGLGIIRSKINNKYVN